jgi:hypothetical protein
MSFLDNENEMVQGALIQEISEHLFEQWMDAQLDEGVFYADQQLAIVSTDPYIKQRFNEFYDLNERDQDYIQIQE